MRFTYVVNHARMQASWKTCPHFRLVVSALSALKSSQQTEHSTLILDEKFNGIESKKQIDQQSSKICDDSTRNSVACYAMKRHQLCASNESGVQSKMAAKLFELSCDVLTSHTAISKCYEFESKYIVRGKKSRVQQAFCCEQMRRKSM